MPTGVPSLRLPFADEALWAGRGNPDLSISSCTCRSFALAFVDALTLLAAWNLHWFRAVPTFVTNFCSVRPAHCLMQDDSLDWLAAAHARAEATQSRLNRVPFDEAAFHNEMRRRIERFGCGSDQIASRDVELDDCTRQEFSKMDLYSLDRCPSGAAARARTEAYEKAAHKAIASLYADVDRAPSDLVHVTCTGYVSPSAAQRLVEGKGWGSDTRVSHAYHMGCYAALPALRIAAGLLHDRSGGGMPSGAPISFISRSARSISTRFCIPQNSLSSSHCLRTGSFDTPSTTKRAPASVDLPFVSWADTSRLYRIRATPCAGSRLTTACK